MSVDVDTGVEHDRVEHDTTDQPDVLNSIPEHSEEGEFSLILNNLDSGSNYSINNLDILIVIRKRVRSCTKYHISKFVSYDSFSLL